jgi:oligopeptide/dipeptide ABC transporter ATP-binding protein
MTAILEVDDLHVHFNHSKTGVSRRESVVLRAVDGLDLVVERGASLGIVGESGCGKSTLARSIVGLVPPTSGRLRFDGQELSLRRDRSVRRRIQMVFQDPASSLNPAMTVKQTLAELLRVHRVVPRNRVQERCRELVQLVELPESVLEQHPRRLSGGQRQRIGIARALAVEPEVLIADEAVAALDVSVQAAVLNLLAKLRRQLDLTVVFIAHDLAVVRNVCDRVAVMYLGRVVEEGPTDEIFEDPRHPYTQALLHAVPRLGKHRESGSAALIGEPPSPLHVPSGCRFHPRCAQCEELCTTDDPAMTRRGARGAACHFAWPDAAPAS